MCKTSQSFQIHVLDSHSLTSIMFTSFTFDQLAQKCMTKNFPVQFNFVLKTPLAASHTRFLILPKR